MRLALWLLLLAVCASSFGCGAAQVRHVTLRDIDPSLEERVGSASEINAFIDADGQQGPDREEFRIAWVNLCKKDPCKDEVAQRYSDLFREVAIFVGGLRQVEFVIEQMAAGAISLDQAKPVTEFGLRIGPALAQRALGLVERIKALDPKSDFTRRPALAPAALGGTADALAQLKDAGSRIPGLLSRLTDANESGSVVAAGEAVAPEAGARRDRPIDLHPQIRARASALANILSADPGLAPSGSLSDEDILRLATLRGLEALERDAQMLEQLSRAGANPPRVFFASAAGPEGLGDWFEAARIPIEACVVSEAEATATFAVLHAADGAITGIQPLDSEFSAEESACIASALSSGRLLPSTSRAGTFQFELSTRVPAPPVVDGAPPALPDATEPEPDPHEPRAAAPGPGEQERNAPTAAPTRTDAPGEPGEPVRPPQDPGVSVLPIVGYSLGGAGAVLGGILGAGALQLRSSTITAIADRSITEREAVDAQARHNRLATWSVVSLASGSALIVGTLVFQLVGPRGTAAIHFDGRALHFAARF